MKKSKKGIPKNIKAAQDFLNIADITNGLLHSNDGYLFSYLWVKGKDANLFSEMERRKFYSNLSIALELEKNPWQIISVPRTVDTNNLIEHLLKNRRETNSIAKLDLINEEMESIKNMAKDGLKEPLIFIKVWLKNGKNAELEIKKRVSDLATRLTERGISTTPFDDTDITYLCKIYADLGEHHESEDEYQERIPTIIEKREKAKTYINKATRSMLSPIGGITFKTNKVVLGAITGKIYGATQFGSDLNYDWAMKMMNCTEAITCITFNLGNTNELADALSNSIKSDLRDANSERDIRSQKKFFRKAEDADKIIDSIDRDGESVGQISVIVMPFTAEEDELNEVCRRVSLLYTANRIKLRVLGQLQKEAFQTLSPYYIPQPRIIDITERIMPLYTLVGGSPMTVNIYKDDNGYYFGKTPDGSIIVLDLFKRGSDRTNSNFVITGKSGTGKSTAIKHIITMLYMQGCKIVVIDPEREYKTLCKNLGGAWIDAGGGNAKINILQIKPVPLDDEEEDNPLFTSNENPLASHMKTLETFFCTYIPSLTDVNKAYLKKTLVELYKNFNITWDTDISDFANTDFPIFTDLYRLLLEKTKIDSEYKTLSALFYDIAEGSDSFLWNGHTNIDTDSDFVCFDTNKLNNASDQIKRTQYFNILTMCWEMMSESRNQKVALICDESYLMVDPNVPQSLMYLRNISKRIRKYNGLLAVITHSLVDFLDERIKMYGQALLEMPTYKLFFGTDGQNLKETTALYNLSEQEQSILQAGVQREALAFFGNQRLKVIFELSKHKLEIMGKGGGN